MISLFCIKQIAGVKAYILLPTKIKPPVLGQKEKVKSQKPKSINADLQSFDKALPEAYHLLHCKEVV
jgi:hypothetical protein